jgi:hypothetical protein
LNIWRRLLNFEIYIREINSRNRHERYRRKSQVT